MSKSTQLCLGTVQLGLPYGITNNKGKVSETDARKILALAAKSGIELLDTAQAYGTAEIVLGGCWPMEYPKRLISKLPAGTSPDSWESNLNSSLKRLNVKKLDGFLLHNASDLLSSHGPQLLYWLESLLDRGLADRIGVSIYSAADLECLPLKRLQLVQLPLSIYDQRLIRDNTVSKLQDLGIAVHARSILLQGLLLQQPQSWPNHFSQEFIDHHARWLACLQNTSLSSLDAALGFIHSCDGIEAALIGVLTTKELLEILKAWEKAQTMNFPADMSVDWAWYYESDLDPRKWPART